MLMSKRSAACNVYDMIPTPKNKVLAMERLEGTDLEVVYKGNRRSFPFLVARSIVEKNPHLYTLYPDSPRLAPSQPRQATVAGNLNHQRSTKSVAQKTTSRRKSVNRSMRDNRQLRGNQSTTATPRELNSNSSTPHNIITALRENQHVIMRIAKTLFVRNPHDPNVQRRKVYASDQFIYKALDRHIPISRIWSLKQLEQALTDNQDHFWDFDQMVNKQMVRNLYMVEERLQHDIVKDLLFDSIQDLNSYLNTSLLQ